MSSFFASGQYADPSLRTFPLGVYPNQSPLKAELDLVFIRLLGNATVQFAGAVAHTEGLEELRKLLWRNLGPAAPFAVWAFVIQQLYKNHCQSFRQPRGLLFPVKHWLTRESRIPKWQHNPSWNQFLSGPHKNGNNEEYLSVLTVEYLFCLTTAIGVFEALVNIMLQRIG